MRHDATIRKVAGVGLGRCARAVCKLDVWSRAASFDDARGRRGPTTYLVSDQLARRDAAPGNIFTVTPVFIGMVALSLSCLGLTTWPRQ